MVEMTKVSIECSFPFISFFDPNMLFLRVILVKPQKLIHDHKVLSFLSTKKKPTSRGEEDGQVMTESQ